MDKVYVIVVKKDGYAQYPTYYGDTVYTDAARAVRVCELLNRDYPRTGKGDGTWQVHSLNFVTD
jgi:hypothetical protein